MARDAFLKTAAPLVVFTLVVGYNFPPITKEEMAARDEGSDTISVTLNSFHLR
jgi:hypothetical protein